MAAPEPILDSSSLSKRAARRLIQRALILAGRNRNVRQHTREARFTTFWHLQDWDLGWTLILDRGKLEFERRPAKNPDLTLVWETAAAFFEDVGAASRARGWPLRGPDLASEASDFELIGDPATAKALEPVYDAFCAALREVLVNPVDENGDPLV